MSVAWGHVRIEAASMGMYRIVRVRARREEMIRLGVMIVDWSLGKIREVTIRSW